MKKLQSYRVRRRIGPRWLGHFVRFVRGDDVCWKNLTAAAAPLSPTASSSRATGEILYTNNDIIIDNNYKCLRFLGIGRRRRWCRCPVRRVPSLGGRVRGAFCSEQWARRHSVVFNNCGKRTRARSHAHTHTSTDVVALVAIISVFIRAACVRLSTGRGSVVSV